MGVATLYPLHAPVKVLRWAARPIDGNVVLLYHRNACEREARAAPHSWRASQVCAPALLRDGHVATRKP